MTLQELKRYPKDMLTPAEAAKVLHCSAQGLRMTAREDPYSLGFPVAVIGGRVKIPRAGLIRFLEGA